MEIEHFLLSLEDAKDGGAFFRLVKHLTGILPIRISDTPAWLTDSFPRYTDRLIWLKSRAVDHWYMDGDSSHHPYTFNPSKRMSLLMLPYFAVTDQLIAVVKKFESNVQRVPTNTELEIIALLCAENAVQPYFTNTAINAINALYYSLPESFSEESGLASMFTNNRIINRAIGQLIGKHTAGKEVSIGEVCSGRRAAKWLEIARQLPNKAVTIHLSDFVAPALPDLTQQSNVVSITSVQHSLLDELPFLSDADKRNVLIATYGFDSVWSEHDARYIKHEGVWYREYSRIKVLDTHPHKEQMLEALRTGEAFDGMQLSDFGSVYIESAIEEVEMNTEENGALIAEELKDSVRAQLNYPGGMIQHVKTAFQRQLTTDGMYIIGDTAAISKGERIPTKKSNVSGVVARYKMEDYLLAKKILEKSGFSVDIYEIEDFVMRELGSEWDAKATKYEYDQIKETHTNVIMTVRIKKSLS